MTRSAGSGEGRAPVDARTLARLVKQAGALALSQRREPSPEPVDVVAARVEEHVLAHLPARVRSLPVVTRATGERGAAPAEAAVVVSALDGAEAWAAGVPTWSVALAVLEGTRASVGVVYVPAVDDLYVAQGGVLRWNGQVVPEGGLEPAQTGFVLGLADHARRSPLRLARRRTTIGSPAYHLALVARGAADGALFAQPRLWEIAPGLGLLAASGGEAIDLSTGRPVDLASWVAGRPPQRLLAARRGAGADILQRLRRQS